MGDTQPPLNYEASATATHPQASSSLPKEVETCLQNARFLHLATCAPPTPDSPLPLPHVSLMNYTFLPNGTPFSPTPHPTIIMTTNPLSLKTQNLISNPNVSLLVHDWISHRPPTRNQSSAAGRSGSPPPSATRSSLASLLLNLNTSALSSISTTITGQALFLDHGSEEETWCKASHLENNTFGDQAREEAGIFGGTTPQAPTNTEDREGGGRDGNSNENAGSCFIEGEDVRVVLVKIREGRIADWKGGVKDWVIVPPEEGGGGLVGRNSEATSGNGGGVSEERMVNGIV